MFERLKSFLGVQAPKGHSRGDSYREATGRGASAEEPGYTRLGGGGRRDLPAHKQEKMQRLAAALWIRHPLGRAMIELPVAYLLGEGLKITVADEEADKAIRVFWKDPVTRMDITLPRRVRDLSLLGEQCWPVFVNEINGHVRLGNLDPSRIATVIMDPENSDLPIGIITKSDHRGVQKRYRVIVNASERIFGAAARAVRETLTDGQCFYFDVNRLCDATRGTSDLLPALDWLEALDRTMFGEMERVDFLRAFVWDVELSGATAEEVEERAAQIKPPAPGSVRVHNEAEKWKAESPTIHAGENAEHIRTVKNYAAGATTTPEHWFGGGGDVNRATGEAMHEPVFKRLAVRQQYLKHILEQVLLFVALRRIQPTGELPDDLRDLEDLVPSIEFPDMTSKDVSRHAAAFQQVVVGCIMALDKGLLTAEKAVSMIAVIAKLIGVEMEPQAILEEARADLEKSRARDFYQSERPGGTEP